nr:hypothetical protein [uncultured Enterobacter sp.]
MIKSYALQTIIKNMPLVNTLTTLRIYPSKDAVEFTYRTRKFRVEHKDKEDTYLNVFEVRATAGEDELLTTDISERIQGYLNAG